MNFFSKISPCRLLALGLLLLALPVTHGAAENDDELSGGQRRWVERTLERMSLEEKAGQLLMVPYYGGFANTDSEEFIELTRQVRELGAGGLIVATRPQRPAGFDRSEVYALGQLTNRLQGLARVPLLVSADFERGAGFRVREITSFPHNMTLGAAGDPELAYEMGRIAATEARALGIHWLLAPVADVNSNPQNPIINIRSYGEDPQAVAEMVAAFIRGCQQAGALCTAKHFPGTGDIELDPHLELATVRADRERLENVELAPFRAAIKAGVAAVMTEHIAVPALEPEPGVPATFSYAITTELLRRRMGFDGLIITDSLKMSAIDATTWPGEAAVRALEAGADVILMSSQPRVAHAALVHAVRSGRVSRERLDRSVERILRAKARLELHEEARVDLEALDSLLGSRRFEQTALEMADRGVVLLRDDEPGRLPLDSTQPQRGFLLAVSADPDPYPGRILAEELKPRVDELLVARTDRLYFQPDEIELPDPELYDWSIVAVFVRVADRKGNVALPDKLAEVAHQVLTSGKPSILVILGSPYLAEHFPKARTVLCTFSTAGISERAAVRALFGQTTIDARLPVTIPGVTERGAGLVRARFPMELTTTLPPGRHDFAAVDALLERAVENGVTPGGVLAVGHRSRLVALHPFGRFKYEEDARRVERDTLYDLASLTKVVATTTAAMMLYERQRLPLDAPVVDYVPEFARGPDAEAKKLITVRHLLTHSSGLPGYLRLYREVESRTEMLEKIYSLSLDYPAGTRAVYSDLGMILLGEIIERVSGRPLEEFLRRNLFDPLGMDHTLFNPPRGWRERIAPTENDREFRERLIHGEVMDENAWVMGGVAPHAGLFSTARDLSVFCQMLLNGGIYAHRRYLDRSTINIFTRRQGPETGSRALGWDTPSEPSSSGDYFSDRAFGHTGYTGTSIWIDPDKELFVVLLTNRVYPTRENDRIRLFRPRVHNAVVEALGLAPAAAGQRAGQSE